MVRVLRHTGCRTVFHGLVAGAERAGTAGLRPVVAPAAARRPQRVRPLEGVVVVHDSGVQRNPLPFLASVSRPSDLEGRKLGKLVVRIGEGCVGSRKVVLAVHFGIFLDALAAGEAADDLSAHAAHQNTADDDENCGRQNDPAGPLEVRQEDQDVD